MKKTSFNKITAWLTVICMLVSLLVTVGMPTVVYAADAPWDLKEGTTDTFLIKDVDDLITVSDAVYKDYWSYNFEQTADITLPDGLNWTPIGDSTNKFTGTYDGNGHTISNLTINNDSLVYLGLFGYVGSGGTLENIKLENVNISSSIMYVYVGGLAAYLYDGSTVSNCSVSGEVTSVDYSYIGGLVGSNKGTVSNSCSTVSVEAGDSAYAGGLVGHNGDNGTVINSYSTGSVSGGLYALVGGLVGDNSFYVHYSYSSGSASGGDSASVGGLAGINYNEMSNNYGTGEVTGGNNAKAGGLVGYNFGDISSSYSTGKVNGGIDAMVGGLSGNSDLSVTQCYYDSETTGRSEADNEWGIPKTTAEMKKQATFNPEPGVGWDFTSTWRIIEDYTYPILFWQSQTINEDIALDTVDLTWDDIKDTNTDINNVTGNLDLLTTGTRGSNISWNSNDTSVVTNDGTVIRPIGVNKTVTLTATVSKDGGADQTKEFKLTVIMKTLDSIVITTPAAKLVYTVGEELDISGMVVTGTYDDGSTTVLSVTLANISGFDSSAPAASQTLTVTVDEKTTTYNIAIVPITYTVTYNGNGGTGTAPTESNKAEGATFIAANNTFTAPSGKQFREWNTAANGTGTSYLPGETVTMPESNLTLYAIWEDIPIVTYTVTYNGNGGTGTAPTESNKAAGATFIAADNSFTAPSGKQFKEWNTAADGTGTGYAVGATVTMPANNLTLYAIWKNKPSTGGGGGGGGGSSAPAQEKTIISDHVQTPDDKNLEAALRQQGQAVLDLRNAADDKVELTPGGVDTLAQEGKGLTLENEGIKLEFAPQSLQTTELDSAINSSNTLLELGARELTNQEQEEILNRASLGESTGIFHIGGKVFDLTAQITNNGTSEKIAGFPEPVRVTMDLSDMGQLTPEEINRLTAVRLEKDAAGNLVPIKLGGTYDPVTKTFTFYTDTFSLYSVLKAEKLAVITLEINKQTTIVNGQNKTIDVPPTIINNRTMVPIRFIGESMGAEVTWNGETRTVSIKLEAAELELVIDQAGPGLDVPAQIVDGRTLVPIRYVSEMLGAYVKWFPSTKTVEIVK